jgi:Holliday junction resolvase RusA-like endonuclease
MRTIEIALKPLTVSKTWKGARYNTDEYKRWRRDFCLLAGKQVPITGDLSVTVELYLKNHKMSDIDNTLKSLCDSMKLAGIIEDDKQIYEIHAYKFKSNVEFIRITVEQLLKVV